MQFDYLNNVEITECKDLATARYLLKIANNYYFAVEHMKEQVDREMNRSESENSDHKLNLVRAYLPKYDSEGNPIVYERLPATLPKNLPARITEAFSYLSAQTALERALVNAELADECKDLLDTYNEIMPLVFDWFLNEVKSNATWLGGRTKITLAGCTMLAVGNSVIIDKWEELNYDE